MNGTSQSFMPMSLSQITAMWDTRIDPAGYAFSIWGAIYSLLGVFAIYQAIPSEWVPDRNDELIFEDIGYVFMANMMGNAAWLIMFQTNNLYGQIAALFDICGMLASNLYIMMQSTRTNVDIFELISLRGGFSIYSGWVTAATILNATYVLQQLGVGDPDVPFGLDEEQVTIGVLWTAFAIYNVAAFAERNPLFGGVFIWVIFAIRNNVETNKSQYSNLLTNTTVIGAIQIFTMLGLTIFLIFEESIKLFAPELEIEVPYWNYGLFYEPLKVLPFGLGDQLMEGLGYEVENDDDDEEEEFGEDDGEDDDDEDEDEEEEE